MVHAHFENAEAALTRHPGEAQWHADMIIVALDGAVHCVRRIAVERMKERFLGAGLSNRARYANDSGGCASARCRAQGIERRRRVADQHMGMIDRPTDNRARRAGGKGLPDKARSEEHTSELQSLMRNSYAVFCLK